MSDLPKTHAQAHSGEYLEVLGKRAAANWTSGEYKTLTAAVTETVKEAHLSTEQVKRVVEFANTAAYLTDFKKEGSTHRVVDFPGGPASVGEVIGALNSGGGASTFDRGTSDYDSPPSTKHASAEGDADLFGAFAIESAASLLPFHNPLGEVLDLRSKLAGAQDHVHAQISGLEIAYAELGDRTYHQVKQAALEGISLGDIVQAWETVAPSPDHIKVAFTLLTPRLLRDGVFHDVETMTASVDKTASARMVNHEHPLVVEFAEFCDTLSKLAEMRETRAELRTHYNELDAYVKNASLAGDAFRGAARGSAAAADAVHPFVEKALGSGAAKVTKGAIKYAPHLAVGAGALVAGSEAKSHIDHGQSLPAKALRGTTHAIARALPNTDAHRQHIWEIENGQ